MASLAAIVLAALAVEPSQTVELITAERLRLVEGDAETRQFLAADKKGRIFVLRESPLSVQRLGVADKLGAATPLRLPTDDPEGLFVVASAMDPAGDAWLVATDRLTLRFVDSGNEKSLAPVDYPVSAVALVGGTPVIAVLPRAASPRVEAKFPGEMPYLLEHVGGKWRPLASAWISGEEALANLKNSHHYSRRLAVGPENRIWLAHEARYLVECLTAGGRRLLKLRVGSDEVRFREATDTEKRETAELLGPASAVKPSGVRVIYVTKAIAAGLDGRLYLLIAREEGGYALDRLDPTEETLKRLVVEGLEGTGFTLAAGADGLYVGTIASGEGRWRLSWDSLETAKWSPVPGAKFERSSTEP
jgi:hypothetical protein